MKILFYLDAFSFMQGLGGGVRRYAEKVEKVLLENGHQVSWNHDVSLQEIQQFDIAHIFSSFTPNLRFFNYIIDRIPTVLSPIYDPVQNSRLLMRAHLALGNLPGMSSNHHSRRHMVRKADFIFTMSEFEKQRLEQDYGISFNSSVLHIPTQQRIYGDSNEREGVLFIGDLSNKRQNIDAVCRIAPKIDTNITLVGRAGSKELMEKVNSIPNIQYLGFVDEETKANLLETHKVFVLPAITSGFGIGAVEAAEMGLIVAYTKSGGTGEYIDTNGFKFDPKKDNELVKCLKDAIRSDATSCLRVRTHEQIFYDCNRGYEKAVINFERKNETVKSTN